MSLKIKDGISLKTQIYGLIIITSLSSFLISFFNNIDSTRNYLQSQMSSHAQDTANSLGLSISPFMNLDDYTIAKTMSRAIFDSGFYQHIRLTDSNGNVIFSLENSKQVETVPQWFINQFTLQAPSKGSEVSNGWMIAGTLEVTTHTASSYRTLWQSTVQSLYNTVWLAFMSLIVAYFILKAIFRPLKLLEKQANLVTLKRFTVTRKMPLARELRTVTQAINLMVTNLQATFDSLTRQAEDLTEKLYVDPLTGLGNRKYLESFFNSVVSSIAEDKPLSALMITLPSLSNINMSISYHDGDKYVLDTAEKIKDGFSQLSNTKIYRLNGGTFMILAPYDQYFLQEIYTELNNYFKESSLDIHTEGYANFAVLSVSATHSLNEVLSLLDTRCIFNEVNKQGQVNEHFSVIQWRKIINNIISSGEVNFKIQPIKAAHDGRKIEYFEVLALFVHNDRTINNCHLFTMAETLNLTIELDKKLIRDFVVIKEQYPQARFAINLSQSSLYSRDFIKWLRLFSQTKAALKNNLIFEFHESSLLRNIHTATLHIDIINEIGINVCVEHFGISLSSLRYIQGLNIKYIKLDGSYIKGITHNTQAQFFIQTVNTICHGFGIKTLASLIEDKETMLTLKNLACDGLQGIYISTPTSINSLKNDINNKQFTLSNGEFIFSN
ncbi:EAL domain-containing protein [Pseudoalteromonas shioyasakiensis]|uniref:bifunctional diguanylate cyclase/phosphodiesterase n=1 Tax=Pseudoalteromonas shioyasakiensis TaxID=1190813 RepID=UPI002117727E|nr:EAL domain-containing protein [Pseudoalteromonas shioyasakiensis]MCQ8876503.1 EAL domain-containing protein [Pseudoalteromonas shioyasakiensis]